MAVAAQDFCYLQVRGLCKMKWLKVAGMERVWVGAGNESMPESSRRAPEVIINGGNSNNRNSS